MINFYLKCQFEWVHIDFKNKELYSSISFKFEKIQTTNLGQFKLLDLRFKLFFQVNFNYFDCI